MGDCLRKPFWSLIANDRYKIGCTGQTVYILDLAGNELAKFKDMPYAYYSALHPGGDVAAIFSNIGLMAIYSLSELRLIMKFRVSAVNNTQTDCIPCFSSDGKYLFHIEARKGDNLNSRLSVYSTTDYQLVFRLFEHDPQMVFTCMEFDEKTGYLFLLGYNRKADGNKFFVGKLKGQSLQDVRLVDEYIYDFYKSAIRIKQKGYTRKSFEASAFAPLNNIKTDNSSTDLGPFNQGYTLDDLKKMNLSLDRLWKETDL